MKDSILIIGANGQIGSELTPVLQELYGLQNVIVSDLYSVTNFKGVFEIIDASNFNRLREVVLKYKINQIYHLAAILSAKGEKNPMNTWDINMSTLLNVLEVARIEKIDKVFFPSSIAVFGDLANKYNTPQHSFLNPSTIYGISKATGENWLQYYRLKYDLDIRSIRYPGIISHKSIPGGGTTDYAVEIFHKVISDRKYTCFLKEDTMLPMMYIDDAIRATIELMEAPKKSIKTLTSYNISGISFTPKEMVESIREKIVDFDVQYKPDYRQLIADNWPKSINDSEAKLDWNWKSSFNLEDITNIMITNLSLKYNKIELH
jgi:threonine 3-dehydrogenase